MRTCGATWSCLLVELSVPQPDKATAPWVARSGDLVQSRAALVLTRAGLCRGLRLIGRHVELAARRLELLGFRAQAFFDLELRRIVAHVLRDAHRTEMRSAHRAEMRCLGCFRRQRLVVELTRGGGIERQLELVFPAELEARL